MELSVLERLDLQEKAADLLGQRKTASGLDLLDVIDQLANVMEKLGYGIQKSEAPKVIEPEIQINTENDIPEIVVRFKSGEFVGSRTDDFISILKTLDPFTPAFISMDEVILGATSWMTANEKLIRVAA